MFLLDWMYRLLAWLGIWHKKKEVTILYLGNENSGKHAMLYLLKNNRLVELEVPPIIDDNDRERWIARELLEYHPPQYTFAEELIIGGIKYKAYTMGLHEVRLSIWNHYLQRWMQLC